MSKKVKRKHSFGDLAGTFVLFCFLLPIIYFIIRMIFPQKDMPQPTEGYGLMLAQCVLGVFACFLPGIIQKRFKLIIPSFMTVLYLVFLYGAIFLGEVRFFYIRYENWDTLLHTFSGVMMGALGFSFVNILNDNKDDTHLKLSPFFVAFFAFCFSVTLGTIWEVYEFMADELWGFNMQKFRDAAGNALTGHEALTDTMHDIVVDIIGSLVSVTAGFISLKYKKGWLERILLKSKKKKD